MEFATLNSKAKTPKPEQGVYQVNPAECERYVLQKLYKCIDQAQEDQRQDVQPTLKEYPDSCNSGCSKGTEHCYRSAFGPCIFMPYWLSQLWISFMVVPSASPLKASSARQSAEHSLDGIEWEVLLSDVRTLCKG